MKWFYSLCTLVIIIYSFTACSTMEVITTDRNVDNPMFDEYYLNIKGVENRLIALMSGEFSFYSVRKKGLWRVNAGKDSIVMHACQIGNPAKDGYWVYQESVMSHLPDVPLDQTLMKIEKQTQDSLVIRVFKTKDNEDLKGIYKKKNREFNFKSKEIKEIECKRICRKVGQTHFICESYNCTGLLTKELERETWTNRMYDYKPRKVLQESRSFYDKDVQDTSTVCNETTLYLKRIPIVLSE